MNIRSITQSSAMALKEALIPYLTTRQKTILMVAFSALALLAACFLVRRCLRNKIVQQPADPDDKKKNRSMISKPTPPNMNPIPTVMNPTPPDTNPTPTDMNPTPSDTNPTPPDMNPTPSEISQPKKEEPKTDPSKQLESDDDNRKKIISSPPLSAVVSSPSVMPGLDRETIKRIINVGSGTISIEECEAFAPDLLKFINDREVQKREFYPDAELPEEVRIVDSKALETYLQCKMLHRLIDPTLRLLVLNGTLAWYGGRPRCGVYAGLDLAHKKMESNCFTRDDLIQLDITQRDAGKEGDLVGLTPGETDLYKKAIIAQNSTVYSSFVNKSSKVIEIPDLHTPVGFSLLQKLVKAGKIHAYNFTARLYICHLMLTPPDSKEMLTPRDSGEILRMRYKNWVDRALLQNYEKGLIRPLSANPSPLENRIISEINVERFHRLVSNDQKAFDFKPDHYTQNTEVEQIFQVLVRSKQIHSYAKDYSFYLRLTAQDDTSELRSSLAWNDS